MFVNEQKMCHISDMHNNVATHKKEKRKKISGGLPYIKERSYIYLYINISTYTYIYTK